MNTQDFLCVVHGTLLLAGFWFGEQNVRGHVVLGMTMTIEVRKTWLCLCVPDVCESKEIMHRQTDRQTHTP